MITFYLTQAVFKSALLGMQRIISIADALNATVLVKLVMELENQIVFFVTRMFII